MNKALYPLIKEMSTRHFTGTSTQIVDSVKAELRQCIKTMGLRKVVSYKDIAEAARIILMKSQQAGCNMIKVQSNRNFYNLVESRYIKDEGGILL